MTTASERLTALESQCPHTPQSPSAPPPEARWGASPPPKHPHWPASLWASVLQGAAGDAPRRDQTEGPPLEAAPAACVAIGAGPSGRGTCWPSGWQAPRSVALLGANPSVLLTFLGPAPTSTCSHCWHSCALSVLSSEGQGPHGQGTHRVFRDVHRSPHAGRDRTAPTGPRTLGSARAPHRGGSLGQGPVPSLLTPHVALVHLSKRPPVRRRKEADEGDFSDVGTNSHRRHPGRWAAFTAAQREPVCFIREMQTVSKGELQGLRSFSWCPPLLLPLPPVGTPHTKEGSALN